MPIQNGQTEIIQPESPFSDIEIQDLIGQPPSWIMRSGITIVLLVTVVILAFSIVIRFPDRVQAVAVVTTENPPIEIVAKVTGKIEKLFVEDNQPLEKGALIAYLESSAEEEDVRRLQTFLRKFDSAKSDYDYLALSFPEKLTLGDFQEEGAAFQERFDAYKSFLRQKATENQVLALIGEVEKNENLNVVLQKEKKLLQKELEWSKKELLRLKSLHEQRVVSDSEYEQKEVDHIRQQRQLEGMERETIRNQIRMEELRSRQLQLREGRQTESDEFRFSLRELKNRIANRIQEWEDLYFLRAPVAGTCNIPASLVEHSVVRSGEPLIYIVPGDKAGSILAQARVGIAGVGKIEIGDRALLRLDPYPYKEYGSVESTVETISLLPELDSEGGERFYTITIPLGEKMQTDYQKEIPYRPNMSGMVQIITKDKSLFYRIFEQFIRLLKD